MKENTLLGVNIMTSFYWLVGESADAYDDRWAFSGSSGSGS